MPFNFKNTFTFEHKKLSFILSQNVSSNFTFNHFFSLLISLLMLKLKEKEWCFTLPSQFQFQLSFLPNLSRLEEKIAPMVRNGRHRTLEELQVFVNVFLGSSKIIVLQPMTVSVGKFSWTWITIGVKLLKKLVSLVR